MIIQSLELVNFRSHENFRIDFEPQTTTIVGENGCGKTSILEAIYETLQGKSFRAVDREIIRRGAEFYRVELEYVDGRKIGAVYDGNKKSFLVEDKKAFRLPKKSKYPVILFEPDDLHLVGASPTTRRSYFDKMFGQLSDNYSTALSRYNKALKQRNELLKDENLRLEDLFSWDLLLARYGSFLTRERKGWVERINQRYTEIYRSIAENGDEVGLDYDSELMDESGYLARLSQEYLRDRSLGWTGFGAHHDNYNFIFNKARADGSASRGEVRSSVLALKFIEAELIYREQGKKPVVLLDDVFSELDKTRQNCLVKNFQDHQVILTSVGEGQLEHY